MKKKRFTSHPKTPRSAIRLSALLLIASLCGFSPSIQMREHSASYNSAEVAWSHSEGTGIIDGVATWNLGRRWPCREVTLFARSAYADETFMTMYGNLDYARFHATQLKGAFKSADPKFMGDARTTRCNADGRFEFSRLPAGTYYISITFIGNTNIIGFATLRRNQQEYVFKRVDVADGQIANIDLQDK